MGNRAGGGARSGGGGGANGVQARLTARYAAMSDRERYKEQQSMARYLTQLANQDRRFPDSAASAAQSLHQQLDAIIAKGGFEANIAKTVKSTVTSLPSMSSGSKVAMMSDRQAWSLGGSIVKNAIPNFYNTHKKMTMTVTSKWGGKTKKKEYWVEI